MKVTSKIVSDIDWKTFEALRARVAGAAQVRVGIPSGAMEEDGKTPSALVAAVHEFGDPEHGTPERPFLRTTIRANRDKYVRLNRINLLKILHGKLTIPQALGQLGEMAKADVQFFIANNTYSLKPITIARKGSSQALVDTANMKGSVVWELDEVNK